MSKPKKISPYSKQTKAKTTSPELGQTFKSRLKHCTATLLNNIEIGVSTITRLNEIIWKSVRSDISVKTCYKCPLCVSVYSQGAFEPICLPCGHTFCRQCLYKLKTALWAGNCPYDSSEFYLIEDLLPVNYSLLDCDSDPFPNTCPNHNSPLIAFCIDDLHLLCGKCFFSHQSHNLVELNSDKALEISKRNLENFKKLEIKLKELLVVWEIYKEQLASDGRPATVALSDFVHRIRMGELEMDSKIYEANNRLIGTIQEFQEVLTVKGTQNADKVIECLRFHIDCAERYSRLYPNLNACERLAVNMEYEDVFQSIQNVSLEVWRELGIEQDKRILLPSG